MRPDFLLRAQAQLRHQVEKLYGVFERRQPATPLKIDSEQTRTIASVGASIFNQLLGAYLNNTREPFLFHCWIKN
jgi:hypothetical protein